MSKYKLNAYEEKPREHIKEQKKTDKKVVMMIISILFLLIAASILLATTLIYSASVKEYRQELDNVYKKSFYDVAADMENIEIKLSKMMVSGSAEQKSDLADNIWRQSAAIASNLASLPLEHEVTAKTLKFVNQLGEYSYSLSKKYSSGKEITEADGQSIESLFDKAHELNGEISVLMQEVEINNLNFTARRNKRSANQATIMLSDGLKNTEVMGAEYPQLIYDGPFSDSTAEKNYRMCKDKRAYTKEEAVEWVKTHIEGSRNIKYSELSNGDLKAHILTAESDGGEIYIQLSENGLIPLLIDSGREVKEAKLSKEEAIESAVSATAKILENDTLAGVWYSKNGNAAYVNLAPVIDDIVYYTDLVMVKIALDDGSLLGLETSAYVINHDKDCVTEVGITEDYAKECVSKKIDITSVRLAVIPLENSTHILTYEINGFYRDINFLFYINAETGEEVKILRVIDSAQGALVE